MANTNPKDFSHLTEVMTQLRRGCPWDREQTHDSLKPYLIEEAYEVIEAIEAKDPLALKEELGDLLLQVLFHAEIASEEGKFTIQDVIQQLIEKLVRRHPHVFGSLQVQDAQEVLQNWSKIKAQEKKEKSSVLAGVPKGAPALIQAQRLGEKAARVGFDWSGPQEVLQKAHEEMQELEEALRAQEQARQEEELGDLLFTLTNLARHLQIDAETALRKANQRFIKRFHYVEKEVAALGKDTHHVSPESLQALWQKAKKVRG